MYLLPYHHNKNLFFLKPRAARAMKNKNVPTNPYLKQRPKSLQRNSKFQGRRFTENEMEVYVSLVKTKLTRNMYLISVIWTNSE